MAHKPTTDERNYYRQQTDSVVPLKWMAPEAIVDAKYTTMSDVWSFGVLLYEVTSLGMTPYGAMGGQELMAELERGYRLPQPAICSTPLFVNLLFYLFACV
jgi:tyrosine-protein kinase Srms